MKTVAIIQARVGSTRLPGKVLKDLAGDTVLAWVVRRARRACTLDEVVVATTNEPADTAIVDECARIGVACERGSEKDVLDRYLQCGLAHRAEVVVRITSDCPLIDPDVIDNVVQEFRSHPCDYASNALVPSYPLGLGLEVFTYAALERAGREASKSYERSHVTPYLYQHPELFKLHNVAADGDYSEHRWTLDTPEDLVFLRAIFSRLVSPQTASWREVLGIVTQKPELAAINAHIHQKALEEG